MLQKWLTVMVFLPRLVMVPEATSVQADSKHPRGRAGAWAGPAYQEAGNSKPALTALDHSAIQMLYGQSNIGFDSGAERGYVFARTFTADGVLVAQGGSPVTGHEQLAALAAKNASCLQTWLTNLMIEPSAEGAIGWAYIWQINLACGSRPAAADAAAKSAVKEAGVYRDVIVKTADGWKFKRRSYTPGHTISKAEKPPA
jgi:SnoaL-like domain